MVTPGSLDSRMRPSLLVWGLGPRKLHWDLFSSSFTLRYWVLQALLGPPEAIKPLFFREAGAKCRLAKPLPGANAR